MLLTQSPARMHSESGGTSTMPIDRPLELSLYEHHFAERSLPLRSGIMQCHRASRFVFSMYIKWVSPDANGKMAVSTTILQKEICLGVPQPSRSAEIIRDVIIIAAITFPVICLRFVSRSLVATKLWWDDWAVGFAAVSLSVREWLVNKSWRWTDPHDSNDYHSNSEYGSN